MPADSHDTIPEPGTDASLHPRPGPIGRVCHARSVHSRSVTDLSPFGAVAGAGIPPHLLLDETDLVDTWSRWRTQVRGDIDRIDRGRWKPTSGRRTGTPAELAGIDIGPLRAVAGMVSDDDTFELVEAATNDPVNHHRFLAQQTGIDQTFLERLNVGRLSRLAAVYDTVPYLIPSFDADQILASEPPDPELVNSTRLPFPNLLVTFTHPLRFTGKSRWLHGAETAIRDYDEGLGETLGHQPDDTYRSFMSHGGAFIGMLLYDHGNGVDDWVGWIVANYTDPDDPDGGFDQATIEFGRRSRAHFGPVAGHIACLASWGNWTEPGPRPANIPETGTRDWRRFTNTNKYRRAANKGVLDGIHILDLGRHQTRDPEEPETSDDTGRTVRPHLRRGHWRGVRVGPRDDWHHEPRWIAPTVVAGDPGDVDHSRETIYRLPDPPGSEPDTQTT